MLEAFSHFIRNVYVSMKYRLQLSISKQSHFQWQYSLILDKQAGFWSQYAGSLSLIFGVFSPRMEYE